MQKLTAMTLIFLSFMIFSLAWAGTNEDLVRTLITDQAKALSEFPKSKDKHAVLKYFSQDYSSITQGQIGDLKDMEKELSDLEEQNSLGNPLTISDRVSNINVEVSGTLAWATFDDDVKIVVMGKAIVDEQSKCTGIYKKKETGWFVQHEHCSTPTDQDTQEDVAESNHKHLYI